MKKINPLQGYAATPETASSYWFMGALLTFFASWKETGGQFALFKAIVRKEYEVSPHTHSRQDESFYILEGEMHCTVGNNTYHSKAGDFIFLPRNTQHTWKALSASTQFLVWITPAGSENVFLQLSQPAPAMELPPDEPISEELLQKAIVLDNEYGIIYAFQTQQ